MGEQGDAERSSAINAAFVVLTDKGARAKHDAMLRSSGAPAATIMCAPLPTPPPPPPGARACAPRCMHYGPQAAMQCAQTPAFWLSFSKT